MTNCSFQRCIAIAGATGYIGGRLVPRLIGSGYTVRCLVRSPGKLASRSWASNPAVEIGQTDFNDAAGLNRNLAGCTAAYYLVRVVNSAGMRDAEGDLRLALQFAQAARDAGVGRIIYLSGLGETEPGRGEGAGLRHDVEAALASTDVPLTILRSAMVIGSGSASFEIVRYLVERLPVMIAPNWVQTPCQPISVRNVIGYLEGVLSVPETEGGTFDIGGSEVLCYREVMQVMAQELGLSRRMIIPVPFLAPRLSSYWIHLITPLGHEIARALVQAMRKPVVCRESRITKLVPEELLSVREAIRAALVNVAEHRVETNWSMAGPIPGDPDWAGGAVFSDVRRLTVEAPDWAVFRAVCRVGGGHGWYAADWLWRIRGLMDRLVGGPGLRRGRRDPQMVGYGEALDFWRVVGYERDRCLALRAEMRLPGEALLEFRIEPINARRCTIHQSALFQPRGLLGLLYWYSVAPLHHFVFRGMLRGIKRKSLEIASGPPKASSGEAHLQGD